MVSKDDKKSPSNEQTKDIRFRFESPFVALRRFADEKIATVSQSIVGLPSVVSKQLEGFAPGLEKIRSENARNRGGLESFQDKFHYQSEGLQNPDDTEDRCEQNKQRWKHIRESIQQGPDAPYTPPHSTNMRREDTERSTSGQIPGYSPSNLDNEKGHQNHMPLPGLPLSFPKNFGPWDSDALGALVTNHHKFLPYLFLSPYSPLILSNRIPGPLHKYDNYNKHNTDPFPYCDAFEDLLLSSRGLPMVSPEEKRPRYVSPPARPTSFGLHEFGIAAAYFSWLQARGLSEWPQRTSEDPEYENDQTELGMYKQFLSSAFSKGPVEQPQEPFTPAKAPFFKADSLQQGQTPLSDSILSALTRTETMRFPDGRVETKVVLVQRFQDGSETHTETVYTNCEGAEDRKGFANEKTEEKKEEKKGWFWG